MENCVFYGRFSSKKQNETSTEAQLAECKAFAERNGYNIVREYVDKEISGRSDARPQFQQMIADSANKTFDAVLVYQLDRFSRNRYDSAIYKTILKKNGVKVLSAKENITDDPARSFIRKCNRTESMTIIPKELGLKISRNGKLNAERGQFNGGKPPLGYKLEIQDFGNYKKKVLVIDEETAPIVKKIFEMRANDVPVKDIIKFLNDNKYKNSRNRPFNKNSLQHLFNNKKYIGINTYGKENEFPNAVPRIIDDELFEKVQNIKEKYKHSPGIKKATERYLLTGKLFCGKCGSKYIGTSGNSKTATMYRYYRCTKRNDRDCKNKTIPKDYIEDIVVRKCKSLLTDKNIEKISKKIYDTCQKNNNENLVIKNLEKKKKQINKNIENLMTALEQGQHIEMISQRITQNEIELQETQSQFMLEMAKIFKLSEKEIKFFLTRLQDGDILDDSYRKVLIDMLVNSILVYDNELVIICNVGNKPITLTVDLVEDIESNLVTDPFTFVKRFGSPKLLFKR